jgi:hypothetical protein
MIYKYVYIYIYAFIYINICTCKHSQINVYIRMYSHTGALYGPHLILRTTSCQIERYVYIYIYIYMYIYIYIYLCIYILIHIYIFKYTYTYIYIYIGLSQQNVEIIASVVTIFGVLIIVGLLYFFCRKPMANLKEKCCNR